MYLLRLSLLLSWAAFLAVPVHAEEKTKVKVIATEASGVFKNHEASNAIDGDVKDNSRWIGTKDSKGKIWLTLKLENRQEISGIHLYSGYGSTSAIQDFHFEYKNSVGKWAKVPKSSVRGNHEVALSLPFATNSEVVTDALRLVVRKTTDDLARVKEVVLWGSGKLPKLEHVNPTLDRTIHQIAVNQVGYATSRVKRFTAPLSEDGTRFVVHELYDDTELYRGKVDEGVGDFTDFRPDDPSVHYVIEISGGSLEANTSDPFLICENIYDSQFWQPAVDFLIDSRSVVGTHNSAYGGCPWRDGTYYDAIIPSLVLFYMADQDRIDAMPRQLDWQADKERISAPSFKLTKDPHSGGALEAARAYHELEPPAVDAPDVVKLIHWGAGYYLVNPKTSDPSGDPEKWKIHSQTVEQVAYVVWAWPVLKKWLPQSFYDKCLHFCINNWEPSMGISPWWNPESYSDIYNNAKSNPMGGRLHPYKGRHAPGHSIVPNLLMYEVAKRERLDNPEKYLNAAIKQTRWIIDTLDWNEPRTTKGQRMSEHRTIPNLVWFLQHYPQHAPAGLKEKITQWAKVAVSRSNNMWDFRRYDLERDWTIPKLNDVGNTLSLPAIALSASWVVDDPTLKSRLEQLAVASVDHVFGRNPLLSAAPDREDMGFPEVERGWPVSYKQNVCARLELCRGSISCLPGTEMYPFNPGSKFRHGEGWVNYGASWCISLSYFKYDENGKITPTP